MHERECVAKDPEVASQGSDCTQEEPEGEPIADTGARGSQEPPDASRVPNVEDEIQVDSEDEAAAAGSDEETERETTEREAMDVDPAIEIPDVVYPTLDEYKEKWAIALAKHSMAVSGEFSLTNLVPQPISELWQDCPHVPFEKLVSNDAVARLSRCRPVNGFTPAHVQDGYVRYAHNTGEVISFNVVS